MIDRLRELLRAATPGEWHAHGCEITLGVTGHDAYQPDDPDSGFYCNAAGRIYDEGGHAEADAAYIAACDPDTIAELLDAHDRMAGALDMIEASARDVTEWPSFDGAEETFHDGWNAVRDKWLMACEAARAALAVPKEESPDA